MRKCLHIVGRFPPPRDGQAIATENLADLLETNYDVHRFSTTQAQRTLVPKGMEGAVSTTCHYLKLKPRLRKALSDGAPVIWGSISGQRMGHWRDLVATLPAFQTGQRVFAVSHWGWFSNLFERWLTRPTVRHLVARIDRFVVLHELLEERIADWIPAHKRCVIPNYVPPCASLSEVAEKQQHRRPGDRLHVLFLSNMMPSKGYLDVLEALAIVHGKGLAVKADFAGRWNSDSDRLAFEKRAAETGLQDIVTHHGSITDYSRIQELHLAADVFLLPTYHPGEAQPMSIIESLSAGTPLVVAHHATIETMVRHGREALFVPPRAPEAIAKALINLNDLQHWQVLSEGARSRYDDCFSADAIRGGWTQLLENP